MASSQAATSRFLKASRSFRLGPVIRGRTVGAESTRSSTSIKRLRSLQADPCPEYFWPDLVHLVRLMGTPNANDPLECSGRKRPCDSTPTVGISFASIRSDIEAPGRSAIGSRTGSARRIRKSLRVTTIFLTCLLAAFKISEPYPRP